MIIDVLTILLVVLLLLNVWVSWRAINDDLSTRAQRAAHILLIWALPFLGALLVLHLQRQHPERHSGRYRELPEAGDEFGASGRGFRRTQQGLENGSMDSSPD